MAVNCEEIKLGRPSGSFLEDFSCTTPYGSVAAEKHLMYLVPRTKPLNRKSRREILELPDGHSADQKAALYHKKGRELFAYFHRYYGDPAATAYDCFGKHYREIALEQVHNQTLQKQRMNSGWRYQYVAKDCALRSQRFITGSDIGASKADFNATMNIADPHRTLNGGILLLPVSTSSKITIQPPLYRQYFRELHQLAGGAMYERRQRSSTLILLPF